MSETLLQMNHIRKHFGDLHVLEDISIEVHRGEVVSIIGPSGSGVAEDLPGDHGTACQGVFRIHPDLFS